MRTLYKVHKWCGLAVAALLLIQALTGLALVFHWDLARVLDPAGMRRHSEAGAVPLGTIESALHTLMPRHALSRLVFPKHEDATYFAHVIDAQGDLRYASIDPGDGTILRSGSIWKFPLEAMVHVHFNLMAGLGGAAVTFVVALIACGLILTGLIVWWPPRRRFRQAFRIHWDRKLRWLLVDLHRVIGAAASALILAVAVTGAILVFEPLLAGNISPAPLSRAAVQSMPMTLDAAFARAREHFPRHEIHDVRRTSNSVVYVLFRAPEVGPRAVHFVGLDLARSAVVDVTRAGQRTNAAFYVLPLHTGEQFGVAGRTVEFIAGLVFILLILSGVTTWFKRPRKAQGSA